jgi:hypothetical protein
MRPLKDFQLLGASQARNRQPPLYAPEASPTNQSPVPGPHKQQCSSSANGSGGIFAALGLRLPPPSSCQPVEKESRS